MADLHLVTGARGVLGRAVVARLLRGGLRVRTLDLFRSYEFPAEVEQRIGDVRDADAVGRAVRGAHVVHHLAALLPQKRAPRQLMQAVNVGGTRNVLDACLREGVGRLVFASTIELYGARPDLPVAEDATPLFTGEYSRNKWECEGFLREAAEDGKISCVAFRMPMIFGPGFYHERAMLTLFDCIRRGLPILLPGDPRVPFTGLWVDDGAEGFHRASTRPGLRWLAANLAVADAPPALQLMRDFAGAVGSRSRVIPVPPLLLRPGVSLFKATGLPVPVTRTPPELLDFIFTGGHYDITRARKQLGWSPTRNCLEMLTETYRWYIENRRVPPRERRLHGLR
ncbi:MAG: NAD(P)-dependent oxidoreductase [Euryarchaeota archaeon]|nr:NAD(P)-dependent oxidoreductase [Euryarchaeota archaeon]